MMKMTERDRARHGMSILDRRSWERARPSLQVAGLTSRDLRDIVAGYVAAAQWSTSDDDGERHLDEVELACGQTYRLGLTAARWAARHRELVERGAEALDGSTGSSGMELVGHNLWLTQVGHGTGFWDRSSLDGGLGEALTDAAKELNESAYGWIGVDTDGEPVGFFE